MRGEGWGGVHCMFKCVKNVERMGGRGGERGGECWRGEQRYVVYV